MSRLIPNTDHERLSILALGVLVLVAFSVAGGSLQSSVSGAEGASGLADGGGAPNTSGQTVTAAGDALASGQKETPDSDQQTNAGTAEARNLDSDARDSSDDAVSVVSSPLGLLGVLVAAGVAAVLVVIRSGGDDELQPDDDPDDSDDDAAPLTDVGRAAGRAADRINDAEPENAVYEAWLEMTQLLDVDNPDTTTPGEFAAAADEAGMNTSDIEGLTEVFEDSRYGGAEITDEREETARQTFRRIEAAYSDENPDDVPAGTDSASPATDGDERGDGA